jgi:universal stress protein E
VDIPDSILVVLDKPKHEQRALTESLKLQRATNARLTLASFVWHPMAEQREVFDAHQRRALKREILRTREEWLRNLVRDRKLGALPLSTEVVWTDDVSAWVCGEAAECDLVAKTVHRSRSMLHTPLDWQLIRECPSPLLLVGAQRPRGRRKSSDARQDVIATLDLRDQDRKHQLLNLRVLDAASHFAEARGGRLHCVAVVEFSEVLSDLELIDPHRVRKDAVAANREFLDALVEPYGIPASRIHQPAGKVGHMVAATARKTGAGLVVVGSAARRGIGARVLGNSAEKILERSPVDLLVVHP